MSGKLLFVVGLGVGYVLGTRQGRGAYERLKAKFADAWGSPGVQRRVADAQDAIRDKVPVIGDKVAYAIDTAKAGA